MGNPCGERGGAGHKGMPWASEFCGGSFGFGIHHGKEIAYISYL